MSYLRAILALVIVGALAVSHFVAYRKGENDVRLEWQAAVAAANEEARNTERARQIRADEAARLAAAREDRLRADAAGARRELGELRDDLRAVREHAAKSIDACTVSLAATADVFQSCAGRYSDLAEEADRHASDSLRLQQAWPR